MPPVGANGKLARRRRRFIVRVLLAGLPVASGRVSDDTVATFSEWFRREGGRAPKVRIAVTDLSDLGVRALSDVAEGEELVSLPLSMVLCRESALNGDALHASPASVRVALSGVRDDTDFLALLLLRERALGERSAWAPYMSLLPQRALPLPSALPEEDARGLLDGVPRARAMAAQRKLQERHARLSGALQAVLEGIDPAGELVSVEAFRWADSLVGSRALTLARRGKFLVPLADFLNYAPHPRQRKGAAGAFFEEHHRVVGGRFVVKADRITQVGAEVFEDYGDNDSELYFHSFGFVPSANPFDCVTVRLPAPKVGSERALLVQRLGVPSQPEVCLRPGDDLPDRALYHLHMLAMSDAEAATCRQEVDRNPRRGAVGCFSAEGGFTRESAQRRLRRILERQLARFKEPSTSSSSSKPAGASHPMAPLPEELRALCGRFAGSRRALLELLVQGLPGAPAAAAAEPSPPPAPQADQELEQLLLESTTSYLAALRAARGARSQQAVAYLPPQLASLLRELQVELSAVLDHSPDGTSPTTGSAALQPPAPGPTALSDSLASFNEWFRRQLGAGKEARVQAVEVADMRIGVEATVSIAAEEVYLRVPSSAILDRHSALASEIGGGLQDIRRHFGRGDPFHELLLHLMYERFVRKESSHWWPYLRLLPELDSLGAPYFMEDRALEAALGPSALLPIVRRQRQEVHGKYSQVVTQVLKHISSFERFRDVFTLANYEWATFILNTRSIWWRGERHLVPMLDFVNCRAAQAGADVGAGPMRVHSTVADADGSAITKAPTVFATGEQIFENYGQPNHVYFLYHGFSLEDNPHDCLLWPIRGDRTCLDPASIGEDALGLRVASSAGVAEEEGVESKLERGRRLLLTDLRKRLKKQPRQAARADASTRDAAAFAFAASERQLLGQLVARLEELLPERLSGTSGSGKQGASGGGSGGCRGEERAGASQSADGACSAGEATGQR